MGASECANRLPMPLGVETDSNAQNSHYVAWRLLSEVLLRRGGRFRTTRSSSLAHASGKPQGDNVGLDDLWGA